MEPVEDVEQVMEEVKQAMGLLESLVPPVIWPWLIVSLGIVFALLVHAVFWRPITKFCKDRSGLLFSVLPRLRRPSRLLFLMVVGLFLVNVAGLPPAWQRGLSQGATATLLTVIGWILIVALDVACLRFCGGFPAIMRTTYRRANKPLRCG